jgi:hypothetical protein
MVATTFGHAIAFAFRRDDGRVVREANEQRL